jgi:hypothetical protein
MIKEATLDRQSQSAQPVFAPYRVPGKRRVSLTAVDHFWTLKSTEYWVVSQVTFIVPPALGLLSIAMAS